MTNRSLFFRVLTIVLLIFSVYVQANAKPKKATAVWYQLTQNTNSQTSNEDVDISISTKVILPGIGQSNDKTPFPVWIIVFTNKSDNMVYIDLAQCFQKFNSMSVSMYAPTATAVSNSTTIGSGAAIGLGGRFGGTVAGMISGTESQTVISYSQQILTIPPHSMCYFPDYNILPMTDVLD